MEIKQFLSLVVCVLILAGFLRYISATLRGKAEPSKASWIIWATLDTIALAGMYVKDAVNSQIVSSVIGACIMTILALRYGKSGWTRIDQCCLCGAVLSIVLWSIFSSPTLGIVTSMAGVLLGAVPTFVSTWKDPSAEDRMTWTLFFLSCIAATIAIPAWTLDDAVQPMVFLAIECTMMVLLFMPSRHVAWWVGY